MGHGEENFLAKSLALFVRGFVHLLVIGKWEVSSAKAYTNGNAKPHAAPCTGVFHSDPRRHMKPLPLPRTHGAVFAFIYSPLSPIQSAHWLPASFLMPAAGC
jgi:hypothetical protein